MKRIFLALFFSILPAGSAWASLTGPIKDFYTPRAGDTTAVVFGTREVNPDEARKIAWLAQRNAEYLREKDSTRAVEVYADTAFPNGLFGRRSLVLLGSAESNALLAGWRSYFPFILRDGRFNISGRKVYAGAGVTLSCIFPSPMANERYVLLLLGTESTRFPSLSDWPGDYDYYVAQRHTFPGRSLNRGKFQKSSSLWSQDLVEYERTPGDTTVLIDMVYPYGAVWYPFRWELDSLWKNPLEEKTKLLTALEEQAGFFERSLGIRVRGNVDFHLSESYPEPSAADPFGRVFIRTRPDQIDSLALDSWFGPLVRAVIPCRDAGLDWELFCHRYLFTEMVLKLTLGKRAGKELFLERGKGWLDSLAFGDMTYLNFLRQLSERNHTRKIGEALDSVTAGGRKYSFEMREFVAVLGRIVNDSVIRKMSGLPLKSSPYGRKPAYNLGIENAGELFLNRQVVIGELARGSKAAAAGLRKGDKLLSVDGLPTGTGRSRAYLAWLGKKKGQTLTLVIERKGVKRTLVIPLG